MTISYPLALPAQGFAQIRITARGNDGAAASPFTFEQQVQSHAGKRWEADVIYPPLQRDVAEEVIAFLLSLRGRFGTFLLGDPIGAVPRGSWAGAPLVDGAHAAAVDVLNLKGFTPSATGVVKKGDCLQLGSGATARLYKSLIDADADGSGLVALDIWPDLRLPAANDDPVTFNAAQTQFRLADPATAWTIGRARFYGVSFAAIESL